MTRTHKTCSICKQYLHLDEFDQYRKFVAPKDGGEFHWYYNSRCRKCAAAYLAEYRSRQQPAESKPAENDEPLPVLHSDLAYCEPAGIAPRCDEFERRRIAGWLRVKASGQHDYEWGLA